jgi:2-aminoadipate transaminase
VLALTSGADESLSRLLSALTEPGDTVLADRIVARPALQIFRRMSVRVSAVPGDESGMDPEALLHALIREKPALVYAAPACPDPSGRSWGDERRRALTHLCEWAGVPLVRDDRQLTLASGSGAFEPKRDGGPAVFSIGQLPPGLFPGLRLGWIASAAPDAASIASAGISPRFDRPLAGRKAALLEAAVHEVALRWLEDPQSAAHREAFRKRCRERVLRFLRAMAEADIRGCDWIEPDGGLHVWIRLPGGMEGEALLRAAWRKGLLFQPGSGFFAARPERNAIRVTPAHTAEARLAEGVRRLGETVAELTGRWAGI